MQAGRLVACLDSLAIRGVKGRMVDQVLRMMDFGFGRSLGVRCQHCHVLGHWADEDKPTKQVARDMMEMTSRINGSTCHRGTPRPGTGPMGAGGPGGRR